jgi:hypothetical protein
MPQQAFPQKLNLVTLTWCGSITVRNEGKLALGVTGNCTLVWIPAARLDDGNESS